VNHLKVTFHVSERRAAGLVGVSRSTLRYQARLPDDEPRLLVRMEVLVRKHPRYGYRRIGELLRREGFRANLKRVYRLWRREGYRVPRLQHKRRRLGSSENACHRRRPEHQNHIWAWDFIFDRDEHGRSLKWLSVLDEYTRECLTLLCARSITATDVIDELIRLMHTRGVPEHIRSDNGPEFIAKAIRSWLTQAGVGTLYVKPGAPWENGYAESFHARLRDELLNAESFTNLREAKALGERWRREYNEVRPHSSLGRLTPSEFAASVADLPVGATPLPPGQPTPS
jgi:putative transposase